MRQELLDKLLPITAEEQSLLDGSPNVQRNLYTKGRDFVVDSGKMLENGKLIDIRPHTRFAHFPKHRHNYIEIVYMCSGQTTHIINGTTQLVLTEGDLLFLTPHASQEILPAGLHDIAINFMVLPQFFDAAFAMMDDENVLREFLVDILRQDSSSAGYIHFRVADILPVQNLIENMIWSLLNHQANRRRINQATMGLLFLQLLNYTDKINQNAPDSYEQNLVFSALRYIEENYRTATLTELASRSNQSVYYLSKLIKKHTGSTYKELLQTKRFNKAVELLRTTKLSVADIISYVGYDNSSYFYRIFKEKFHMSPKDYRDCKSAPPVLY